MDPATALDFRRPMLVPMPTKLSWRRDVAVRLGPETRVRVVCPDPAAAGWARAHLEAWFGFAPRVEASREAPASARGDEGYALHAEPGLVELGARTLRGAKWAAHALRQAAERVPGGPALHGWWLPALDVEDAPALPFRALHLCWFPEMSASFVEREIRLAAYYRFNHVILEPWGTFRSSRRPELFWPDAPLDPAAARRLAALASDLGTTLVPAFNVLGHAGGSPWRSAKHCALDLRPELQTLFEPDGGWNWCLSNPDAVAAVRDVVEEMHDAFGSPPFFHVGCDEAEEPSCPACRAAKPYAKLVLGHLLGVRDLLARRGARAMVWHDMLLARDDPRWAGFVANGAPGDAPALLDALPRDVVVCEWFYGPPRPDGAWPAPDHFKSLGFDTVACSWDDLDGISSRGRHAREAGLFGAMQTTWIHVRGAEYGRRIEHAARAAWGEDPPDRPCGRPAAETHWRQVGWDAGVSSYDETGLWSRQHSRESPVT